MSEGSLEWIDICDEDEVPEDDVIERLVGARAIALNRIGGGESTRPTDSAAMRAPTFAKVSSKSRPSNAPSTTRVFTSLRGRRSGGQPFGASRCMP